MTDDEIVYLIHAHYATSGEIFDVIIFARAIEHCTLTKQKARWYQEGLEAGNTQAQELYGKTEQLEAENKRLQELADYRLKLLTKMPSEWVSLTDEDMEGMFLNAEGIRIARYIETRLKEKNNA